MKVLVIEDEDDIREVACMCLADDESMEVIEAGSGKEGIRLAQEKKPDVILMDVMMPDMDGKETFKLLHNDPATSSIPVIFLTAKAMTSEVSELRALGAKGILVKPFDPLALPLQIKEIIEGA
ncbi:MAG TPA: response regulator [Candidatus Obscuribacterales bacterium]